MNKHIFDIIPVAAARPRITRNATYYPKKYNQFRKDMKALVAKEDMEYCEGAVYMDIDFYMPIPKSFSKKKRESLVGALHIKKPDRDNLDKAVLDCLSGVAFKDDSQVCDGRIRKIYSLEPRIEIRYTTLNNPNFYK